MLVEYIPFVPCLQINVSFLSSSYECPPLKNRFWDFIVALCKNDFANWKKGKWFNLCEVLDLTEETNTMFFIELRQVCAARAINISALRVYIINKLGCSFSFYHARRVAPTQKIKIKIEKLRRVCENSRKLNFIFRIPNLQISEFAFGKRVISTPFWWSESVANVVYMLKQTLNLMELEVIFGREHTQLSRLQYHLIERLYGQHSWLVINNMDYCVHRFLLYNKKKTIE